MANGPGKSVEKSRIFNPFNAYDIGVFALLLYFYEHLRHVVRAKTMSCSAIFLDSFGNLICKKMAKVLLVNCHCFIIFGQSGQLLVNIKATEGLNMSRDTISIHFVNAALSGVKRLGMDVDTLSSHVES